jgi:hypothetical protein
MHDSKEPADSGLSPRLINSNVGRGLFVAVSLTAREIPMACKLVQPLSDE